jgi:carbon-monoxide dehydrogenase medium subunit
MQLIGDLGDEGKILAGGHSLIPVMRLRLSDPENLIDITAIEELKTISESNDTLTIGSCATHAEIATNNHVHHACPMMTNAAAMIGDIQVRNFGTIGGSIAHADPAADWPGILMAANATINLGSVHGYRSVLATDFFHGLFMTALQDEELIISITIPKNLANSHSSYAKHHQPASRFAIVGCAVALESRGEARVAFNGVSSKPFRDTALETKLSGKELTKELIEEATASVADGVNLLSDHFASDEYRKHLAGVYAKKALMELIK